MKSILSICLAAALLAILTTGNAQTLNWQNANPNQGQNHTVNLNTGWDYGLTFGVGYGYQLKTKLPIVLKAAFSVPSGEKITDDFKSEIGVQVKWLQLGNFCFSTDIGGIFRRYENSYARLLNFGSNTTGVIGYYKPKWFLAGEVGFDKAIITHFKSTPSMRENFPGAKDGWYEPATGGNFHYGLQAGVTIKRIDIYVKAGKVLVQDFKTDPLIPFYVQLGVNRRFGGN